MYYIPTQEQFEVTIRKIKRFIEIYREKKLDEKLNTFFLSDGTVVDYFLKSEYLAELLGIEIENLKELNFINSEEPLEQLEQLVENSAIIYEMILKRPSIYSFFFTKYFSSSIFGLAQIQNVPVDRIDFVSRYDSLNQSKPNHLTSFEIDYYVSFSEKNNTVFLGLKKSSNGICIPCFLLSTNSVNYCQQMFHIIIPKQSVMIASGVRYQPSSRYNLSLSKSHEKVKQLQALTKKYDGYLILTKDYLYSTESVTKLSIREHATNDILRALISHMENGVPFNSVIPEDLEIIKELIGTYNQTVTQKLGRQRVMVSPEQK